MINPDVTIHNTSTETNGDIGYRQLADNLPVAVYACDAQGYISYYNKASAALWGNTTEIGKDKWCGAKILYYPDGKPMLLEECPMAITIKTGRATNGEIIIERPDGTKVNITAQPVLLYDDENNIRGALNTLTDITARKQDEKNIASLAAIVQYSDDAIIGKTLSSIITSWNAAAERIFGYTASEIIGQSITKLIPDDRQEEEPLIIERLKRGERVDHFETKRITKDRKLIDVSLTISPVKDPYGNVIGISKIARDITEQKIAEQRIRENEERIRMAVASTRLGTWDYNPQSGELDWSPECRGIYGVAPGVAVSFDLFSALIHPGDADRVLSAIHEAMDASGTGNYDIKFRITRHSDQRLRWVHAQGQVYFDDNRPERFIGTVLDITEEKLAKEELEHMVLERTTELKKANEELGKSNKELEQFAYVASHDLQEPLRKILTFADRLKLKGDEVLTDELNSYIQRITNSAEKMSALISGLLDYARIGRAELQFIPTNLCDVFTSVTDDLDFIISKKHAEINTDELPVIEAIPLQMNQLFYNLLNNSLKFSREGIKPQITIQSKLLDKNEAAHLQLNENTRYFMLKFTDNGIGFNEAYSERIFTIFQRLNNKETYPGTGIGLALCKKVVDNHGGLIFAEGNEDTGSTFTIVLPEKQSPHP